MNTAKHLKTKSPILYSLLGYLIAGYAKELSIILPAVLCQEIWKYLDLGPDINGYAFELLPHDESTPTHNVIQIAYLYDGGVTYKLLDRYDKIIGGSLLLARLPNNFPKKWKNLSDITPYTKPILNFIIHDKHLDPPFLSSMICDLTICDHFSSLANAISEHKKVTRVKVRAGDDNYIHTHLLWKLTIKELLVYKNMLFIQAVCYGSKYLQDTQKLEGPIVFNKHADKSITIEIYRISFAGKYKDITSNLPDIITLHYFFDEKSGSLKLENKFRYSAYARLLFQAILLFGNNFTVSDIKQRSANIIQQINSSPSPKDKKTSKTIQNILNIVKFDQRVRKESLEFIWYFMKKNTIKDWNELCDYIGNEYPTNEIQTIYDEYIKPSRGSSLRFISSKVNDRFVNYFPKRNDKNKYGVFKPFWREAIIQADYPCHSDARIPLKEISDALNDIDFFAYFLFKGQSKLDQDDRYITGETLLQALEFPTWSQVKNVANRYIQTEEYATEESLNDDLSDVDNSGVIYHILETLNLQDTGEKEALMHYIKGLISFHKKSIQFYSPKQEVSVRKLPTPNLCSTSTNTSHLPEENETIQNHHRKQYQHYDAFDELKQISTASAENPLLQEEQEKEQQELKKKISSFIKKSHGIGIDIEEGFLRVKNFKPNNPAHNARQEVENIQMIFVDLCKAQKLRNQLLQEYPQPSDLRKSITCSKCASNKNKFYIQFPKELLDAKLIKIPNKTTAANDKKINQVAAIEAICGKEKSQKYQKEQAVKIMSKKRDWNAICFEMNKLISKLLQYNFNASNKKETDEPDFLYNKMITLTNLNQILSSKEKARIKKYLNKYIVVSVKYLEKLQKLFKQEEENQSEFSCEYLLKIFELGDIFCKISSYINDHEFDTRAIVKEDLTEKKADDSLIIQTMRKNRWLHLWSEKDFKRRFPDSSKENEAKWSDALNLLMP